MFIVQLLFLQLIMFVGLIFVLRKLMGRHATTATAHLQGLSQDYLRKQDELKKRLEEGERQYQEQLAKAQAEAHQLKMQTLQEADATRQKMLDQAREEADRIVHQANQARESLQREATQSIDDRIADQALSLLQSVLPQQLKEPTHRQWVDELVGNGMVQVERLETREQIREARVVSAYPMTPAQRQQLKEKLEKALGTTITIQEAVDPRIIAGLVITLGHLVMDGSLASKLREAAHHGDNAAA